ncbi:uncharacterized protein LOC134289999 [Aedes albopictus]|uniref:Uncharacterized protein n=1 Tax=Aedes albopictus TaxID=7160 RepID=A0ABM1YJU5_AEDAL
MPHRRMKIWPLQAKKKSSPLKVAAVATDTICRVRREDAYLKGSNRSGSFELSGPKRSTMGSKKHKKHKSERKEREDKANLCKKKKKKKDREKKHKHHKEKRRNRDDSSQEDFNSFGDESSQALPEGSALYAPPVATTPVSMGSPASLPVTKPFS